MSNSDSLTYSAATGSSAYFIVGGTSNTISDQRNVDTDEIESNLTALDNSFVAHVASASTVDTSLNTRLTTVDTRLTAVDVSLNNKLTLEAAAANVTKTRAILLEKMQGLEIKEDPTKVKVKQDGEKEEDKTVFSDKVTKLMVQDYMFSRGVPGYADCSGELKAYHAKLNFDNGLGEVFSKYGYIAIQAMFKHIGNILSDPSLSDVSGKAIVVEELNKYYFNRDVDISLSSYDEFLNKLVQPIIDSKNKNNTNLKNLLDSNALRPNVDPTFTDFSNIYIHSENKLINKEIDWYEPLIYTLFPIIFIRYREAFDPSFVFYRDASGDAIPVKMFMGLPVIILYFLTFFSLLTLAEDAGLGPEAARYVEVSRTLTNDFINSFDVSFSYTDPTVSTYSQLYNLVSDLSNGVELWGNLDISDYEQNLFNIVSDTTSTFNRISRNSFYGIVPGQPEWVSGIALIKFANMEATTEETEFETAKTNYFAAVEAHAALL